MGGLDIVRTVSPIKNLTLTRPGGGRGTSRIKLLMYLQTYSKEGYRKVMNTIFTETGRRRRRREESAFQSGFCVVLC